MAEGRRGDRESEQQALDILGKQLGLALSVGRSRSGSRLAIFCRSLIVSVPLAIGAPSRLDSLLVDRILLENIGRIVALVGHVLDHLLF